MRDRRDQTLENRTKKKKKEITRGHYNAQSLQSNLLDKRTTSFCIFPSLLFGRLYWTNHLLFFPANIDHSSPCFLDTVFSIYQYLFCCLLADFNPLTFYDILYTLTPSHSHDVSKPFRSKKTTPNFTATMETRNTWSFWQNASDRSDMHTDFIEKKHLEDLRIESRVIQGIS
jgi:hypothetical protein